MIPQKTTPEPTPFFGLFLVNEKQGDDASTNSFMPMNLNRIWTRKTSSSSSRGQNAIFFSLSHFPAIRQDEGDQEAKETLSKAPSPNEFPVGNMSIQFKGWSNTNDDMCSFVHTAPLSDFISSTAFCHQANMDDQMDIVLVGHNTNEKVSLQRMHAEGNGANLKRHAVYAFFLSDFLAKYVLKGVEFVKVELSMILNDPSANTNNQMVELCYTTFFVHDDMEDLSTELDDIHENSLALLRRSLSQVSEQFMDILDQGGVCDYTLLDIDALLDMAINTLDKSGQNVHGLDWYCHGGQWMHLFWLCEKVLDLLLSRSAVFDLVCFLEVIPQKFEFSIVSRVEQNDQEIASWLLARQLLLQHFQQHCKNITCHVFRNTSTEWKDFVFKHRPNSIISCKSSLLFNFYNIFCLQLPVITEIEENEKSIFGNFLQCKPTFHHGISKYESHRTFDKLASQYASLFTLTRETLTTKWTSSIQVSLLRELVKYHQAESVHRLDVITWSIILHLTRNGSCRTLFYGVSLIATLLLQEHLPVHQRHLELNEFVPELTEFIQEVYKYCFSMLYYCNGLMILDSYDFLDSRLAHWLTLLKTKELAENSTTTLGSWINKLKQLLPSNLLPKFEKQLGIIIEHIPYASSLLEHEIGNIQSKNTSISYAYIFEEDDHRRTVLEVDHPFINKYCKIDSNSVITTEDSKSKSVFKDIYHYHSSRLIDESSRSLDFNNDVVLQKSREKLETMAKAFQRINPHKVISKEPNVTSEQVKYILHAQNKQHQQRIPSGGLSLNNSQLSMSQIEKECEKFKSQLEALSKDTSRSKVTMVELSKQINNEIHPLLAIVVKRGGHHKSHDTKNITDHKSENNNKNKSNNTNTKGSAKKKSSDGEDISVLLKNLIIQLLTSFKLQLPKQRNDEESKYLQKTVTGASSKIVLSREDEKKALFKLYHVNSWIRFIYNYLQWLETTLSFLFTDSEIRKEMEYLATTARMFGFVATADAIQKKPLTDASKDVVDPNYLFLKHFEFIPPTTPSLELFTKQQHVKLLDKFTTRITELATQYNHEKKSDQQERISEELRNVMIMKKLRENLTFVPDQWQNDMIDHVNHNRSVLVSVPTSNGKTFIVHYVIEKVLRESDTGVIAFVVPNKALVNQIYCDVSSRYEKKILGKTVVGMATANVRIDVFNCQVLILTPAMLEIYLMSATEKLVAWRKNIKYLVLDEIHCITEDDQGDFYEHCIQLLDCPIIGLSATIGNAEKFKEWIKHSNRENIQLIYEPDYKRYAPLEYYTFNNDVISHSHPCGLFNSNNLSEKELSQCRMMTIDECFQLSDFMLNKCPEMKDFVEEHVGHSHLKENKLEIISWSDHITYKKRYNQMLVTLAQDSSKHGPLLQSIVQHFSRDNEQLFNSSEYLKSPEIIRDMISLITLLKKKQLLPAIIFIFDRKQIDAIIANLCMQNISLWDDEDSKPEGDILRVVNNLSSESSQQRLHDHYLHALHLGIGAHYSGIDDFYQMEVERLFREKKLPLIICTSTLALGVHLPCSTVVMGGASIYLNKTLFKQCCGRVGRRGVDQKGRVILYGLEYNRVRRYLLSEPITVNGTNGLKPSFLLKTLISLNSHRDCGQEALEYFEGALTRLLERPLFSINANVMEQVSKQMSHYVRFNTEFLRQTFLLNKKCQPLKLSGLAAHIHYREPFNFLFTHFIQTDLFSKKLDVNKITEREYDKIVLVVFSLLFARLRASKFIENNHRIDVEFSESMKNMYEGIRSQNKQFNKEILKIFSNYAVTYFLASTHDSQVQNDLYFPCSKLVPKLGIKRTQSSPLSELLQKDLITCNASISSFAALSGNKDNYYINEDHFISCLKHTMYLNKGHLPFSNVVSGDDLNSFLLDYYHHGKLELLCSENRIATIGMANKLIEEATRDLKKLRSSLINEEVFNYSITDYLKQRSSEETATWLHNCLCRFLPKHAAQKMRETFQEKNVTFLQLFDWISNDTFDMKISNIVNLRGKGLKLLRYDVASLFLHPLVQSMNRIIQQFTAKEAQERQALRSLKNVKKLNKRDTIGGTKEDAYLKKKSSGGSSRWSTTKPPDKYE
ncbi:hypothetical protein C9374_005976 [Naegleria lovaniensis]|uniref:Uncharacterized protein n=1 Tax=Naegleria lovaniensis TaxID=51637 RepID=A0AA88GNR0_NAELO|nr:uncharacterized protein C9374_005976 [Naegleria lovaniensis]KAG2381592.1 hypothetical protein C9374_005976 [Naegleria lovaniensis]